MLLKFIFGADDLAPDEYIAIRAIQKFDDPDREADVKSSYFTSIGQAREFANKYVGTHNLYFGVVTRNKKRPEKQYCHRAFCVWADCDPYHAEVDKKKALDDTLKKYPMPPSAIVDSGGGYHLYWKLKKPTRNLQAVSDICILLEGVVVGGGSVSDPSRVLRLDNSFNRKDPENVIPVVVLSTKEISYDLEDLEVAASLPQKAITKIVTGAIKGYKSRSELDWYVITELIKVGMSDEGIMAIYHNQPIGQKVSEPGGDKYLEHTLSKAREATGIQEGDVKSAKGSRGGIFEKDDCYWVLNDNGVTQLSTFTFQPEILLEGDHDDPNGGMQQDVLVGTIKASGSEWEGVHLSRKAFVRSDTLIRELPLVSWQWLGRDTHVKELLPYLTDKLRAQGLPRRKATPSLGFHDNMWLGTTQTMTSTGIMDDDVRHLVILPTKGERPIVSYTPDLPEDYSVQEFFELLPEVNKPGVIWPIIGWMAACPYKTRLQEDRVRFPVLNLFGTRGSGKTSMLTEVVQQFSGYDEPRTYDCTTTQFVILSLLGSSNGVPVAFSEYRRSLKKAADRILRYLLLSYDTGHDPRGKPDQTVVDYPLLAPFSIDGEDSVSDAAAMERIVQVRMSPDDIDEGSSYYEAFQYLQSMDLKEIGSAYLRHTLQRDHGFKTALKLVRGAFPDRLPDRVRRNLAVAVLGLMSMKSFAEEWHAQMPEITPDFLVMAMSDALSNVVSSSGRTLIMVDEFIEDVINHVAVKDYTTNFASRYDDTTGVFWLHLSSAFTWWLAERRRQDRPSLELPAIKNQLIERQSRPEKEAGQYVVGRQQKTINGRTYWCYGIDMSKAHTSGLDVPTNMAGIVFKVRDRKEAHVS